MQVIMGEIVQIIAKALMDNVTESYPDRDEKVRTCNFKTCEWKFYSGSNTRFTSIGTRQF